MARDDTTTLVCQAEGCAEIPSCVCEIYLMTPPQNGYVEGEAYLCEAHAAELEYTGELSILTSPTNEDLVSVARWRN